MHARLFIGFCIFVLALNKVSSVVLTEPQVIAAGKVTRNICQSKTKVTDAILKDMQNRKWSTDRKLMCYIECCLQIYKVMKSGNFDIKLALVEVERLPEKRKKDTVASLNVCKDAATGADKCERAYNLAKCMQNDNPENVLIP